MREEKRISQMIRQYENCTRIYGNLEITYISREDLNRTDSDRFLSFLDHIQQVHPSSDPINNFLHPQASIMAKKWIYNFLTPNIFYKINAEIPRKIDKLILTEELPHLTLKWVHTLANNFACLYFSGAGQLIIVSIVGFFSFLI